MNKEFEDAVTDERKPREWDVIGAKKILDDYKLPSECIDIGNVYYAATQLEAAYDDLERQLAVVIRQREAAIEEQGRLNIAIGEAKSELASQKKHYERMFDADRLDDWKRIQDAERALERYRDMCEKLAEAILQSLGYHHNLNSVPSLEEALAAYNALKEKK